MIETLTILPMAAPGTRSRRTGLQRRATPVLLPKLKHRQTTLDHHLHSAHQRGPQRVPQRSPPPPQRASRPQMALQHAQLPYNHSRQTTLPFAIGGAPTRSIQNILNHADHHHLHHHPHAHHLARHDHAGSMSAGRTKRKAAADADSDADVDAPAVGSALEAALRKKPRLAVEILDYAKRPLPPTVPAPVPAVRQAVQPPPAKPAKTQPSRIPATIPPATTPTAATTTTNKNTRTTAPTIPTAAAPSTSSSSAAHPTAVDREHAEHAGHAAAAPLASAPSNAATASRPPPKPASQLAPNPKDKAVNGFKQELKGLHASTVEAVAVAGRPREGGRKLRSQEAARFKSDLSAYFPDYDEVIGNEPKEEHVLNIDTPILLVESSTAFPASLGPSAFPASSTPLTASLRSSDKPGPVPVKGYGDRLFYDVFDSHVLDFTFLGNQHKGKGAVDPLPDSYFEAHHKRAERLERSIRNTEKGRAQHEKDQIIRLLEGLQGPDWLRTMGVSGITESKKKTYEPARDHFIRGCRAILEKFRMWSQEEKRRKLEKDRAHAEEVKAREAASEAAAGARETVRGRGKAAAADKSGGPKSRKRRDTSGKESGRAREKAKDGEDHVNKDETENDAGSAAVADGDDGAKGSEDLVGGGNENNGEDDEIDDDSQPDSSDFDAVIARQLREEALARSRLASKKPATKAPALKAVGPSKRRKTQPPPPDAGQPDDPAAPVEKEVKSFFQKRYQRDAALSRSRRKGRTVMAWGQPVPEPAETDFHLPGEMLEKRGPGRRKRGGARVAHRG